MHTERFSILISMMLPESELISVQFIYGSQPKQKHKSELIIFYMARAGFIKHLILQLFISFTDLTCPSSRQNSASSLPSSTRGVFSRQWFLYILLKCCDYASLNLFTITYFMLRRRQMQILTRVCVRCHFSSLSQQNSRGFFCMCASHTYQTIFSCLRHTHLCKAICTTVVLTGSLQFLFKHTATDSVLRLLSFCSTVLLIRSLPLYFAILSVNHINCESNSSWAASKVSMAHCALIITSR